MRRELFLAQVMRINNYIGIIFIILLVSCLEAKRNNAVIRIGAPTTTNFMHIFVAEEKGIFKKNGIDVKVIPSDNINELYSEKQLDVICTGLTESILFSSEGHETKIIYRFTNSFATDLIIASSKIKDLSSLKGKKISFQGINSSSHIFIQQLLSKHGIQDGEYFAVNLPVNKVIDELRKGNIDAGHITGVSPSEIIKKGFHIIGKSEDDPNLLSDTLSVDGKFLKKHEPELKLLVKSIDEAHNIYLKNPEESIEIFTAKTKKTHVQIKEELEGLKFLTLLQNQGNLKEPKENSKINPQGILNPVEISSSPKEGARNPGMILPGETMNFNSNEEKSGLFTAGETIIGFLRERGQIYKNPSLKSIIDDRFVKEFEEK